MNFLPRIEANRHFPPLGRIGFDKERFPVHSPGMRAMEPKNLGQFIVADPGICRGRPTFKGTRVTVADVLADVEQGLSWDFICYRWGDGRISKESIAEAVQL